MKPARRIPIAAAKHFAKTLGLDQVIIVGWTRANGLTHVTTYGQSLDDCKTAAIGGNVVKRALQFPEEMCQDKPARQRRYERKHGLSVPPPPSEVPE